MILYSFTNDSECSSTTGLQKRKRFECIMLPWIFNSLLQYVWVKLAIFLMNFPSMFSWLNESLTLMFSQLLQLYWLLKWIMQKCRKHKSKGTFYSIVSDFIFFFLTVVLSACKTGMWGVPQVSGTEDWADRFLLAASSVGRKMCSLSYFLYVCACCSDCESDTIADSVRVLSLRSSVIHGFVTWHSHHVLFSCEHAASSVLEPCSTSWFCGVRCVPGSTYIVDHSWPFPYT